MDGSRSPNIPADDDVELVKSIAIDDKDQFISVNELRWGIFSPPSSAATEYLPSQEPIKPAKSPMDGIRSPNLPADDDFELVKSIAFDDKDQFISVIELQRDIYGPKAQAILDEVCAHPAIKCAEALVLGETPLTVNLNAPCCPYNTGMLPLHRVAYLNPDNPAITELLVYYGARTDIRFNINHHQKMELNLDFYEQIKQLDNMLPLQMVLQRMVSAYYSLQTALQGYYSSGDENFIYKLITILCLPRLQNQLETIAILAGTTMEFGEVFFQYALEGKIVELACLLVAAPKEKLHNVIPRVQQYYCDSVRNDTNTTTLSADGEDQPEKLTYVHQLLEVFDKAGDRISEYVKENKHGVCKHQAIWSVKQIFTETGFHLIDSEAHSSADARGTFNKMHEPERRCLDDFGMAHYSESGYRWKVSSKDPWLVAFSHEAYLNELKREIKLLKEKKTKIDKVQQQLNSQIWMDDELWTALEKDDKEKFLSVIDRNVDVFRSRQQQILYNVCSSGSIKCAEALIKGETPLTVDLHVPCTDTGLYPLHCAALSFSPSVTELLLYHGAQTGNPFIPRNPSVVFPQHLLEVHTGKLPLHMALHAISRLPCMREWTVRHSITKLIALLCLPRMQDPLETLGLLAVTTKETKEIFLKLAEDGKFVELAALLTVANSKVVDVMKQARDEYWSGDPIDDDQREINESGNLLYRLFVEIYDQIDIASYVKEDKYDVSKYQVMDDVKSMIEGNDRYVPLDTDFSCFNWYRIEESSYPSKAPYEYTTRSPDVGMEHYSKSSFRWRGLKKQLRWRNANRFLQKRKLKHELALLRCQHDASKEWLQKEMKPMAFGIPYIARQGVPIASSSFFFQNCANAENKIVLSNNMPRRAMSSMAAQPKLQNSHSERLMLATVLPFNLQNSPLKRGTRLMASLLKQL